MVESILVYAFALATFIFGILLLKGKGLRLVAGNTFLPKEKLDTDAQRRNAKYVGVAMLLSSLMAFLIATLVLFKHNDWGHLTELTVLIVVSGVLTLISLVVVLLKTTKES